MALDQEAKERLMVMQDEAGDILADITSIFPPNYSFTLLARNWDSGEADIVLTNDTLDEAIAALQRNKDNMEA